MAPEIETKPALLAIISIDIRKIPLEDEKDDLVTDAYKGAIARLSTANARALASYARAPAEM